jgi:hypothetical protein
MMPVKRALISVSNKEGVIEFARGLADLGIEIISTGGTAKTLREIFFCLRCFWAPGRTAVCWFFPLSLFFI